jgi:hypothetical protein
MTLKSWKIFSYLVFGQNMAKIVQSGKAIGGRGTRLLESISGKILLLERWC